MQPCSGRRVCILHDHLNAGAVRSPRGNLRYECPESHGRVRLHRAITSLRRPRRNARPASNRNPPVNVVPFVDRRSEVPRVADVVGSNPAGRARFSEYIQRVRSYRSWPVFARWPLRDICATLPHRSPTASRPLATTSIPAPSTPHSPREGCFEYRHNADSLRVSVILVVVGLVIAPSARAV